MLDLVEHQDTRYMLWIGEMEYLTVKRPEGCQVFKGASEVHGAEH